MGQADKNGGRDQKVVLVSSSGAGLLQFRLLQSTECSQANSGVSLSPFAKGASVVRICADSPADVARVSQNSIFWTRSGN
jgi:hypothetical protein